MEIKRCVTPPPFFVIGKEGSTNDSDGFIQRLWNEANSHFAGIEAIDEAKAPEVWTKWKIPGYEYLYVKCTEENIFPKVIAYMQE